MTSTCVEYPAELPVSCLKEIVRIIRMGALRAERAAFARHVWSVQGYLQSRLLGSGERPIVVESRPDDWYCQVLDTLAGAPAVATTLSWRVLLRWLLEKLAEALEE